jgi:outer membrane receptor protein involved in Fe transport
VFGNAELRRALIENYDLRWETYPSRGEVMSVALFSKRFRDPIERVILPATGAPVLSFRNARSATNYGVELEMRRRLGFIAAPLDAVTVGTNATLVRSEVDFGGTDAASSATSQKRALLGQAPYVVNLSLIYEAPGQASATILLNAIGERITEVGLAGIPDAYEQPRTSFDITLEHPVRGTGKLRLQAENLLDARSEIRQGSVTRSSYRTGRSYSLGYSFEP